MFVLAGLKSRAGAGDEEDTFCSFWEQQMREWDEESFNLEMLKGEMMSL